MKVTCKYCGHEFKLTADEVEAGVEFIECGSCDAVIKTGLLTGGRP